MKIFAGTGYAWYKLSDEDKIRIGKLSVIRGKIQAERRKISCLYFITLSFVYLYCVMLWLTHDAKTEWPDDFILLAFTTVVLSPLLCCLWLQLLDFFEKSNKYKCLLSEIASHFSTPEAFRLLLLPEYKWIADLLRGHFDVTSQAERCNEEILNAVNREVTASQTELQAKLNELTEGWE